MSVVFGGGRDTLHINIMKVEKGSTGWTGLVPGVFVGMSLGGDAFVGMCFVDCGDVFCVLWGCVLWGLLCGDGLQEGRECVVLFCDSVKVGIGGPTDGKRFC